ncbi:MAG: soluble lytic murein transglycosylase [Pseudomonadota bacterium]|nr:soluble lytic murein transglycosylase [Pseudomonadota bacterium]
MPRVPTYDNFQQMPAQFQPVQIQPATPRVDPGAQAASFGQAAQRAGAVAMDMELEALKQANQLRVDDALNKALEAEMRLAYDKDAGYTSQRGLSALERESGKPLADEYDEEFGKAVESIGAGLGNDYQRQVFGQAIAKRRAAFRAGAMKHEADEFRTYTLSVREGTIATRMQQIGLNYANPEVIDEAITSIRAATYDAAKLQGKSAEWADAQARKMASNAHKTAIAAALEKNDVAYADRYLKRYGKDMEADDLLQTTGLITKEMDLRVGTSAATEVMGRWAPKIVPGDMDRLTNIVMGIESAGRRFDANGKLLEGPATKYGTAKGEMQVLDGTNRDPGYGVKPAADDSPEERARVGRDYLAAMVREYDGDVSKALAAYNWGPGNLDKAVKEHGPNWLQAAPEETRSYVERGVREFGAGAGRGKRPSLAEIKADLRGDPMLAGNPARLKAAEETAEKQYRDIEAAEKQATDEALDTVYRGLYANGGNMNALPVSVRAMIPGDKLGAVMGFADTVRKSGGAVHNPEAWAQILSMPRENLAAMSPIEFFREFRPHLDDAHLEKGYALLNDARGEVGTDAKHLEVITAANRVKKAAIDAGLLPATGKANDNEVKAFAQFERLVDDRARQFEATDLQGKRKANSAELQQIIDGTLMDKVFVSRTGWFDREVIAGLAAPEDLTRAYVNVGGQEVRVAQIPANQRAVIASKLQSRGLPVTEQRIAELWVAAGRPQ